MIIITLIIIKTIKKTIQNYQKDTIKIMLQYLPLIAECTKKSDAPNIIMQNLLHGFQNVSEFSGALRNKGLTLKHENVLCWLDNENAYGWPLYQEPSGSMSLMRTTIGVVVIDEKSWSAWTAYSLATKTFSPLFTAEIGRSDSLTLIYFIVGINKSEVFIKSYHYLSGTFKESVAIMVTLAKFSNISLLYHFWEGIHSSCIFWCFFSDWPSFVQILNRNN